MDDLKAVSQDKKGGLSLFLSSLSAELLAQIFPELNPLSFSLAYCQWRKVEDLEWVRSNIGTLRELAERHILEHGYFPCPVNVVRLARAGHNESGEPGAGHKAAEMDTAQGADMVIEMNTAPGEPRSEMDTAPDEGQSPTRKKRKM